MMDWIKSLLGSVTLRGVTSRRLASVVLGAALLVWICSFATAIPIPEVPASVLILIIVVLGTSSPSSP